jgi:multimeric flavodoxin WrbA
LHGARQVLHQCVPTDFFGLKGENLMSGRQIIIVNGSPRKNGNSTLLAEQVAAGARSAGAVVESFMLHTLDIRPCDACDVCQETAEGMCVIRDDMQLLYPRLQRADAIVIASPIYWFSVSAQTKLFIDRCYALDSPQGSALAGKQFGIVLTYGDSDPFSSGAVNAIHMFQDACRYLKADVAGIIHGSASKAGEIRQQPVLLEKAYQLGQHLGNGA